MILRFSSFISELSDNYKYKYWRIASLNVSDNNFFVDMSFDIYDRADAHIEILTRIHKMKMAPSTIEHEIQMDLAIYPFDKNIRQIKDSNFDEKVIAKYRNIKITEFSITNRDEYEIRISLSGTFEGIDLPDNVPKTA